MYLRAYKIYKKRKKNNAGQCWMKFVLDQTFRPTFSDIQMSKICGVPQKIKRRESHKQGKREEAKMESKKEKDSNAKKDWTGDEVSLLFVIAIHQLMQHCKCGYVLHIELLNEWTFELLNFTVLDETCLMKVCE